jgi:hypothetical protein
MVRGPGQTNSSRSGLIFTRAGSTSARDEIVFEIVRPWIYSRYGDEYNCLTRGNAWNLTSTRFRYVSSESTPHRPQYAVQVFTWVA